MINYCLLMKPGIIFGNLVTFAAGFALGARGSFNFPVFFATLFGLGLIIASGCVFNNYIDRSLDKKMERTKKRPLVTGAISEWSALLFGAVLLICGNIFLLLFTNGLAVAVADLGFSVYVFLYSLWKGKTVYSTAIGSVAGACPPVVGYCAASGQFDLGAALLFALLVIWQMPHFHAIALLHLDDYTKGGIPVLPAVKGVFRTKIHMIAYVMAFIPVTLLLSFFGYTGLLFFVVTGFVGVLWLALSVRGLLCSSDRDWGRQMFVFSLVMIGAICVMIPYDKSG